MLSPIINKYQKIISLLNGYNKSDIGGNRYSLLGLTSNLRFAYYICDICFYTWILVDREMSNEDIIFKAIPYLIHIQCFSKIIIFRFIILTFFSPRKKIWAGKIFQCEPENERKIEEAYRFDGWGTAEKETAKSSIESP